VGVTCVLVTHDQEEAMTMADHIAVMREGRFLQLGTPSELYEHPKNRFVADFIGNVNLFEGQLVTDEPDYCEVQTDEALFRIGHGITGPLGMALVVALRPEKSRSRTATWRHPATPCRGRSPRARTWAATQPTSCSCPTSGACASRWPTPTATPSPSRWATP